MRQAVSLHQAPHQLQSQHKLQHQRPRLNLALPLKVEEIQTEAIRMAELQSLQPLQMLRGSSSSLTAGKSM